MCSLLFFVCCFRWVRKWSFISRIVRYKSLILRRTVPGRYCTTVVLLYGRMVVMGQWAVDDGTGCLSPLLDQISVEELAVCCGDRCSGSMQKIFMRCGSILEAVCVLVRISASCDSQEIQCSWWDPSCWPWRTKWNRLSMWRVFLVSLPFLAICTVASLSIINMDGVVGRRCEDSRHCFVPRYVMS